LQKLNTDLLWHSKRNQLIPTFKRIKKNVKYEKNAASYRLFFETNTAFPPIVE